MTSLHSAFKNKTVLITGHTGFKGSWLALWLNALGAKVCGYALKPPTGPGNFSVSKVAEALTRHIEADIRDHRRLKNSVREIKPDFIFHLAAQPLVRESYRTPRETFETNVGGTVNLLDAVRALNRPCVCVVITSDKCYENTRKREGYREGDPMGGHDPYSASKGAAELVIASYRCSFFNPADAGSHGVMLSSARSGNVVGGGDWAPDRIMTDCVTALIRKEPIIVRNPAAVRPWQHVLEPLSGYLRLAAQMSGRNGNEYCQAWNFGPPAKSMHSVTDLVEETIKHWGRGAWRKSSEKKAPHEAALLTLSSVRARRRLAWRNHWNFSQTVEKTVAWYKAWHGGKANMRDLCLAQIEEHLK